MRRAIEPRERGRLDRGDLSRLIQHRALVPGATDDTLLVGVSKHGPDSGSDTSASAEGFDVRLTAEDVVATGNSPQSRPPGAHRAEAGIAHSRSPNGRVSEPV